MPERVPPHNIEAEQSTLGSMMLEPEALHAAQTIVAEADFYRPTHQTIYDVLVTLAARDEPVDIITVTEELRRRGKLDDCGGVEYLMSLVNSVPTAANVEHYARIVEQKSVLRKLIAAGTQVQAAAYREQADAADVLMRSAIELCGTRHSRMRRAAEIVNESWDRFSGYQNGRGAMGLRFGIRSLDTMLHGVGPGELVVIGGRPSQGKTVLLCHLFEQAAIAGAVPLLFSAEMTTAEVMERIICMRAHVDSNDARDNKLTGDEWDRIAAEHARLADCQFLVDEFPGSLTQLCAKSRRAKLSDNVGIILIDYWQLIRCDVRAGNRDEQMGIIGEALKNLAKELGVPVVIASQLNRNIERRDDKMPQLADLRDGGNQEGHADKVVLIYNPLPADYRPGDKLEARRAKLIVAKYRGGRIGTLDVWFTPYWTRFDDCAGDMEGANEHNDELARV